MDLVTSSCRPTQTFEAENVNYIMELESWFALNSEMEGQVAMEKSQPSSSTLPVTHNPTQPQSKRPLDEDEQQVSSENPTQPQSKRARVEDEQQVSSEIPTQPQSKRPLDEDEQQVSSEMQKSLKNRIRNQQYRKKIKEHCKNMEQKVLELTAELKYKDQEIQQLKFAQNQSLKIRAITTTVTVKCSCSRTMEISIPVAEIKPNSAALNDRAQTDTKG